MLQHFQSSFKNTVVDEYTPSPQWGTKKVRPAGALADARDAYLIYRRAYYARLTDALKEKYEAVCGVLGDLRFKDLAKRFIEVTPSTSYSLSDYGESFDTFLVEQPECANFPYLGELARFEKAFMQMFHKPQHLSLRVDQFATLLEDPTRALVFGDACFVFYAHFRVHDLWKLRHVPNEIQGKDFEGDTYLVMYKCERTIYVKMLERFEYELLLSLKNGMALEDIDFFAGRLSPEQISNFFHFIATSGLVIAISERGPITCPVDA